MLTMIRRESKTCGVAGYCRQPTFSRGIEGREKEEEEKGQKQKNRAKIKKTTTTT